jgi:hypothetical protein
VNQEALFHYWLHRSGQEEETGRDFWRYFCTLLEFNQLAECQLRLMRSHGDSGEDLLFLSSELDIDAFL